MSSGNRELTDEEVTMHIGTIPPMAWVALMQFLTNVVEVEVGGASAPDLADGARHYNAGRLAMAVDVKSGLEVFRDAGVDES